MAIILREQFKFSFATSHFILQVYDAQSSPSLAALNSTEKTSILRLTQ